MKIEEKVDYLLSRKIDPLSDEYATIVEMIIKSKLYNVFIKIEQELKCRIYITKGWAHESSREHSPQSLHYWGLACDFVLFDPISNYQVVYTQRLANKVEEIVKKEGFWFLDEYKKPSPKATAGHFHIEWRD